MFRDKITWFHLHKSDIVPALKLLVPVFLFFVALKTIPSYYRSTVISNLDSETTAVIDTIEHQKGIQHSLEGSRLITNGYLLKYHYHIDLQRIDQKEMISKKMLTIHQSGLLTQLEKGDSIAVKYDSENIHFSRAVLE